MSIRLRLTLTYTLILALTLVGFSAIVYGIQAGTLLVSEEQRLETIVQRAADRPRPAPARPGGTAGPGAQAAGQPRGSSGCPPDRW